MARTTRKQMLDVTKARQALDTYASRLNINKAEALFVALQTGINEDYAQCVEDHGEQAALDLYGKMLNSDQSAAGQLVF